MAVCATSRSNGARGHEHLLEGPYLRQHSVDGCLYLIVVVMQTLLFFLR